MKANNANSRVGNENVMHSIKISIAAIAQIALCQSTVEYLTGKKVEISAALVGHGSCTEIYIPVQKIYDSSVEYRNLSGIFRHIKDRGFDLAGFWHSHGMHNTIPSTDDYSHIKNLEIKNKLYCKKMGRQIKSLVSIITNSSSDITLHSTHKVFSESLNSCDVENQALNMRIAIEIDYAHAYADRISLIKDIGDRVLYKGKRLKKCKRYKKLMAECIKRSKRRETEIAKIVKGK